MCFDASYTCAYNMQIPTRIDTHTLNEEKEIQRKNVTGQHIAPESRSINLLAHAKRINTNVFDFIRHCVRHAQCSCHARVAADGPTAIGVPRKTFSNAEIAATHMNGT